MTNSRFEVPTWSKIYTMLLAQADRIGRSCFKPEVIVGISRGGLIPARILSDLLENPNLADVGVEFYSGKAEKKEAPILTREVSVPVAEKQVLVVDDVADSGRSLDLVRKNVLRNGAKEARIGTLYYKPWSIVKPDFFEEETKFWVVFPWDLKETIVKFAEKNSSSSFDETVDALVKAGFPKKIALRFLREKLAEKQC